jgi:hypothetical protein
MRRISESDGTGEPVGDWAFTVAIATDTPATMAIDRNIRRPIDLSTSITPAAYWSELGRSLQQEMWPLKISTIADHLRT